MFHVADPRSIATGRITDEYFARSLEILRQKRMTKRAEMSDLLVPFTEGGGSCARYPSHERSERWFSLS